MKKDHHDIDPPGSAVAFFSWYCKNELKDSILGDLEERFHQDIARHGARKARLRYWLNVVRFINRHTLRTSAKKHYQRSNHIAMVRNYFLVALRQLQQSKVQSFINIFGLAVGFTCCLLIALYIMDELNYDTFHDKADRIYRISSHSRIGDNERHWSLIPSTVAPALLEQLPEIEAQARIATLSKAEQVVKYGEELYDESTGIAPYGRVFYADPTIFEVFTYTLTGNAPSEALKRPNTVVITRRVADKLFKTEEPLGKTLEFSNLGHYEVTGIVEHVPGNSHFQFDYLLSSDFDLLRSPGRFFWVRSYIVLKPGAAIRSVEAKLDTIGRAAQPSLIKNGIHMDYFTQEVSDIHLTAGLEYEIYPTSDIRYVYIFLAIAVFILIIASINFVNLSTAQVSKRAKEVGIRKVLGAGKSQMLLQFSVQSVLVSLIAFVIALALLLLSIGHFNQFTHKQLSLHVLFEPAPFLVTMGIVVCIGLLAGLYPALVMSRFSPMAAMKQNLNPRSSSQWLRKILVIFQFGVSVVLIVSTYTIVQQLHFLRNKPLGFDSERLLTVPIDGSLSYEELNTLKDHMLKVSGVHQASLSTGAPALNTNVMVMLPEGFDQSNTQRLDGIYADFDFLETYAIKLIAGRDFNEQMPSDSLNFIMNESAIAQFGWTVEEAIGKAIDYLPGGPFLSKGGYVIGVMEDFHYQTLHNAIGPLMLGIHSSNFQAIGLGHISLKTPPSNLRHTVAAIEEVWKGLYPDKPFHYAFLEGTFHQQYKKEEWLSRIISSFALLAIAIACLGLLGLASFIMQQKTKEIGIRKVLGATFLDLWSKVSGSFVTLIVIGNLVAWPLAYYFLEQWLAGFAYRIEISFWVFIAAGLSSVIIALMTIGYQTIKGTLANPVESLRYE